MAAMSEDEAQRILDRTGQQQRQPRSKPGATSWAAVRAGRGERDHATGSSGHRVTGLISTQARSDLTSEQAEKLAYSEVHAARRERAAG